MSLYAAVMLGLVALNGTLCLVLAVLERKPSSHKLPRRFLRLRGIGRVRQRRATRAGTDRTHYGRTRRD